MLLITYVLSDTYEENNPEAAKENNTSGIENNQPTQKQDNETTTESASGEQSHERSGEQDESTESVATDVEGGVALGDVMDEDEIDYEESDADSSSEDSGADDDGDDGTTRFQTYEEPDLDNPAIDVDTDAVNQFINEFAVTDPEGESGLGMKKDPMITAFTKWAKINNVELDELTEDKQLAKRKGTMKKILNTLINSESKKVSTDDGRVRGYTRLELSDEGEMLLDQNAE